MGGETRAERDADFLRRLALAVAGREPTDEERAVAGAVMNTPSGYAGVVEMVELAPETSYRLADGWYGSLLRRPPAPDEREAVHSLRCQGSPEEDVLAGLVATEDFAAAVQLLDHRLRQGDEAEQFARAVHWCFLSRPAGKDEVAALAEAARGGARAEAARTVLYGVEYRRAMVASLFAGLLHRLPTPHEAQGYARSGWDMLRLRVAIESSPEFYVSGGGPARTA